MKKLYIHPTHLQNFRKKEDIVLLLTDCLKLSEIRHSLEVLRMIKSGILDCRCWGICSNFKNMFGETWGTSDSYEKGEKCFKILEHLMRHWKHYSGSITYPVPSTIKGRTAAEVYNNANKSKLWSKTGNYGRMRYNLVNWLIACLYLAYQERIKHEKASHESTEHPQGSNPC